MTTRSNLELQYYSILNTVATVACLAEKGRTKRRERREGEDQHDKEWRLRGREGSVKWAEAASSVYYLARN